MSNGCGCEKGLLRYVRPPLARYFYAACCVHDDAYDRGGDTGQRKKADKQLFFDMLRIIQQREEKPFRALLYAHIALLYYISVRLFGRFYFNYSYDKDN